MDLVNKVNKKVIEPYVYEPVVKPAIDKVLDAKYTYIEGKDPLKDKIKKKDEIYLKLCHESYEEKPANEVMGYKKINEYSNEEAQVWIKGKNEDNKDNDDNKDGNNAQHIIVAFRGTKNFKDLITDMNVALEWLNGQTNRSKASSELVKKLKQKYKCPYTYTG